MSGIATSAGIDDIVHVPHGLSDRSAATVLPPSFPPPTSFRMIQGHWAQRVYQLPIGQGFEVGERYSARAAFGIFDFAYEEGDHQLRDLLL